MKQKHTESWETPKTYVCWPLIAHFLLQWPLLIPPIALSPCFPRPLLASDTRAAKAWTSWKPLMWCATAAEGQGIYSTEGHNDWRRHGQWVNFLTLAEGLTQRQQPKTINKSQGNTGLRQSEARKRVLTEIRSVCVPLYNLSLTLSWSTLDALLVNMVKIPRSKTLRTKLLLCSCFPKTENFSSITITKICATCAIICFVLFHMKVLFATFSRKKNQGVFVKHYAHGSNKVYKAIFSFKVKVKVTRSLTLVSFERASLVEYTWQIWSLYLLRFKS